MKPHRGPNEDQYITSMKENQYFWKKAQKNEEGRGKNEDQNFYLQAEGRARRRTKWEKV
jgi:hypothetical protein